MSSRTFNQSAVVLLSAIMLQACGGGGGDSSSSTTGITVPIPSAESCQAPQAFDSTSSTCVTPALRGQFVDKPVAGLYYETGSGIQGYTDATGSFGYRTANEQVKFSVGKKVDIGYAQAAHVVHVYDLEATQDERLSGVNVRRAQVLQSLDANLGKAEVIKLPAGIDQKLPANYVLKYDATQTEFDASLKELLSKADLVAQFVGADAAKTSADSYIAKSVDGCPLKIPTPPSGVVVGSLTCLDIARIRYYQSHFEGALINSASSAYIEGEALEGTYAEEGAKRAIDTSLLIGALEYLNGTVETVESGFKKEVVNTILKASGTTVKTAKFLIDTIVVFEPLSYSDTDEYRKKQLEQFSQYAELVDTTISAFGDAKECSEDVSNDKCLKFISGLIKVRTQKPDSLATSKEVEGELKNKLKIALDEISVVLKGLKALKVVKKGGAEFVKASFGVARSGLKLSVDGVKVGLKGNNVAVDLGLAKTADILVDTTDTILNLGENCWNVDRRGTVSNISNCFTEGTKSLIGFGVHRVFEAIHGIASVSIVGKVNESIISQQLINEVLYAGNAGLKNVFDHYHVGIDDNDHRASFVMLARALVAKRTDMEDSGSVKSGYGVFFDYNIGQAILAGYNGKSLVSAKDAANDALIYLQSIYNATPPDFNSPNVDIVLTPKYNGEIHVGAQYDPAGFDDLKNGEFQCVALNSKNYGDKSPITVIDNIVSFDAKYDTGGVKVVICSVYNAAGTFKASKAIAIQLSTPPKVQTARATDLTTPITTIALGETIVSWLNNVVSQITSILWEVFDALGHSIYSAVSAVSEAVSITFDTTGDKTIQATYRDASDSTLGQTNTTVTVGAGMAINNITYSPTLQLNQPSTITVTGTDFPETVLLALTNAECGAPFDYYHIEAGTGFSQVCTPRTSGEQTLTVKRATGVNAGSVARNANVTNAVLNSITLPDTRNASDFIKLDESGNELSSDASSWACTKDKLTGLIWEIKTKDGSIQDSRGLTSSYGIPSLLDSLNGKKWCGLSNWRMPEQKDLYTLTNFDGTDNEGMFHVENTFFPDWVNTSYYTGYPYGGNSYSYPSMHQFYPKSGMTGTNGSWEGCCYPMQGRMVAGKSVLSADRFEYSPDGSYVYDALLDLTWQRCPIGSKFNNNYCEDTATVMTLEQVKNTLVDNWRLPNAKELVTYGAASYNGTWSSSIFDSSKNLNVVIYGSGDVGYLDTANTQSRATAYLLKSGKQFIGSRYIKISNAGASLPPNAVLGPDSNSWACTKDSQTGLTWEVKTDDGGLRDKDWAYSWYDPNPSTNGGNSGFQNIGYCQGSSCDTASYIAALNPTKLCGYSDWRMPRINELSLLMYNSSSTNSVNQAYFPNSISNIYVSATPSMEDSDFVWIADGNNNGYSHYLRKDYSNYVRAVRSNNP